MSRSRRTGRSQVRGQAMLEYSVVLYALVLALAVPAYPVLTTLIDAVNTYFHSIYYVVMAPVP